MRADDFFTEEADPVFLTSRRVLNTTLIDRVRRGSIEGHEDVEVAIGLARLIHDDLERFGTAGGEQITEQQMREALVALRSVAIRAGAPADMATVPFRDYGTFKGFWLANGAKGNYQARRDLLNTLFTPLQERLLEIEAHGLDSTLAEAISPRKATGWLRVDEEIAELRRHFRSAATAQDFRNVGNDCVAVLEALSAVAYDPAVNLRPGETEPPVDRTKIRLQRYVEDALTGPDNESLRGLVRQAIEFAQRAKHNAATDRREAGISADAVILLSNILRRLAEPAAASTS